MIRYNKDYNELIKKICEEHPTSYMNILKSSKYNYLCDYILSCTKGYLTDKNSSFGKKINWVLNELQDFPVCKNQDCNKKVIGSKQIRYSDKWPSFCCNRCAQKDISTRNKIKNTKLQKYGDENYNGDIAKLKEDNNTKYGCDWYVQSEDFKAKTKKTWKKHGYEHPMKSSKIRDEMSKRYEILHGVKYSCLDPNVIKKARIRYYYDKEYFNSSWELAYYIYLKDHRVNFTYQPNISFNYIDDKGNNRTYFPDFIVNGTVVEIKGDQFILDNGEYHNPYDKQGISNGVYEAKHKCMVDNNVKILSKDDIEEYLKYCRDKFKSYNWQNNFRNNNIDELHIDRNDGNLRKDFIYFRDINIDRLPLNIGTRNYIIKYFQQDVFFKKEKELFKEEKIRNEIIQNRIEYLKKQKLTTNDILTGFKKSGIYYGYSHFNPLWFKWFIQNYNIKTCYDPCGGWGHRLLGGLNLEKYIYNDFSKSTKENVDRIIEYFKIKNTITYNENATQFEPKEEFEAIFTCPPYFNVEKYECGEFKTKEEYDNLLKHIYLLFKNNKNCRILGIVIREDFLIDEMKCYDDIFDIYSYKESYLSKLKNKNKEYMYVFKKNFENK